MHAPFRLTPRWTRLQLGALDNLAYPASALGQWDEWASWGARYRALAHAIGSRLDVARGQLHLALAAQALGDPATAIRWHEQSLVIFRATGDRRMAAVALRYSGGLHLELGNLQAASQCCAQAQTLHQTLDETIEACRLDAQLALCECHLGQPEAALSTVNALLDRLASDLADNPAHKTLDMRWTCQQVLEILDDARATAMLEQLYADVHARAAELTDGADRDRLIQALPVFRGIVAAQRRHGGPTATH